MVKEIRSLRFRDEVRLWGGKWITKLEVGTIRYMCEVEFRCQNERCKVISPRLDFMPFQ